MGGENNVKAIATTKFQDGGVPITTGDCYMHRQASFYYGLFPEGTVVGPPDDPAADVTFFYLPVAEEGDPRVMLGAGDLLVRRHRQARDVGRHPVRHVGRLCGGDGQRIAPGALAPQRHRCVADHRPAELASFAELLASSEVFRFDGADMMPGAVGSGTFWTEATAWIVGGSTEDMLDNIEASWPAS